MKLFAVAMAARLLIPGGAFHGEEVGARPQSGWWALAGNAPDRVIWTRVKPSFQTVFDPIVDDDPAKPTGVSISSSAAHTLFLARDLGLASAGRDNG